MRIIYGAGDFAKRLKKYFCEIGMDIDCFCTSYDDGISEVDGLTVISYDTLLNRSDKSTEVFIAISDSYESRRIKIKLFDNLPSVKGVYEFGDFIKGNLLDYSLSRIVYERTDYEEGLAKQYWEPQIKDENRLSNYKSQLYKDFSDSDIEHLERIIDRMSCLATGTLEDDFYTADERKCIRKFEENYRVSRLGDIQENAGYCLPAGYGMDPTVFYYKNGVDMLRFPERIAEKDIIDAGAYIGDSSIVLSQYTNRKVYAIEACADNYGIINEVCDLNHVHNVVPVCFACGDSDGETELFHTVDGVGDGIVERKGIEYRNSSKIPMVKLDSFIKENGINVGLIKADIEGGEMAMIKGAAETIREQKPAMLISVYHTFRDFFEIKDLIKSIDDSYRFRLFQPYVRNRIIRDTMIICESY